MASPFSRSVHAPSCEPPHLSELHLWRVQPNRDALYDIIRPSKGQQPIVMTAIRMSGRKMVMGIWVVSNGEAISISAYDPKAVETIELTVRSGWWTELGLPPLTSMTPSDLDGLAAYITQGVSLQVPETDRKGRVDMSKALLVFTPSPPPPPFRLSLPRPGPIPKARGCEHNWKSPAASAIVMEGYREPREVLVRGWDSSMGWRMTNVVTLHEQDWSSWPQLTPQGQAYDPQAIPSSNIGTAFHASARDSTGKPGFRSDEAAARSADVVNSVGNQGFHEGSGKSGGDGGNDQKPDYPAASSLFRGVASQAGTERLCQAIADRLVVVGEGTGGVALRLPRNMLNVDRGAGSSRGTGVGDGEEEWMEPVASGGRRGSISFGGAGVATAVGGNEAEDASKIKQDLPVQTVFLSHKDMERRIQNLDQQDSDDECTVDGRPGTEPRRPLEFMDEDRHEAQGKIMTIDEVVQQLRADVKAQADREAIRRERAVGLWKFMGRVLCRLLRMSDYWHEFISVASLTQEERVERRIAVLQEVIRMRVSGAGSSMKAFVRVFADKYPAAMWSRFRQLMKQPKEKRNRRDMSVCAILLSDLDNSFLRENTRGWPFPRLVDLTADTKLIEKPALAVLYEEGELESTHADDKRSSKIIEDIVGSGKISSGGIEDGPQGGELVGQLKNRCGPAAGELRASAITGAYVVLRGAVDLYLLERGAAAKLPTAAAQEALAMKAARGQPMRRPNISNDENGWDSAENERILRHRRQALAEEVELVLAGSSPGPRRPRLRNLAPRWKACRLGPGAMFGDRPVPKHWYKNDGSRGSRPSSPQVDTSRTVINKADVSSELPTDSETHQDSDVMSKANCPNEDTRVDCSRQDAPSKSEQVELTDSLPDLKSTSQLDMAPDVVPTSKPVLEQPMANPTAGLEVSSTDVKGRKNQRERNEDAELMAAFSAAAAAKAPAMETAITVKPTELLAIGVQAYRTFLAEGTRRRLDKAVAVLRATDTMEGVPTPALERVCRYAFEHKIEPVAASTNTSPTATSETVGTTERVFKARSGADASRGGLSLEYSRKQRTSCDVICRQGNFRGTAFFVVDGHAEVVIGDPGVRVIGSIAGGSGDGSLLRRKRKKRHRKRVVSRSHETKKESTVVTFTGYDDVLTAEAIGPELTSTADCRNQDVLCTPAVAKTQRSAPKPTRPQTNATQAAVVADSDSFVRGRVGSMSSLGTGWECRAAAGSEYGAGWSSGDALEELGNRAARVPAAAVLKRGDFFGIASTSEAASSANPSRPSPSIVFPELDNTAAGGSSRNAAAEKQKSKQSQRTAGGEQNIAATDIASQALMRQKRGIRKTAGLAKTSRQQPSEFPGLHKASLVAGSGGVSVLAVGLAVLQRVCPPVHRRLARAAATRYSGWISEAERRDEDEWLERLENESVQSLSKIFYKCFANGRTRCKATDGHDPHGHLRRDVHDSDSVTHLAASDSTTISSCSRLDFDDCNSMDNHGSDVPVSTSLAGVANDMHKMETPVLTTGDLNAASPQKVYRSRTGLGPKTTRRRGMFDLSRAFRNLRACSSARTVSPVRLGRALPPSSDDTPLAVLETPVPPPRGAVRGSRHRASRRRHRERSTSRLPDTSPAASTVGSVHDSGTTTAIHQSSAVSAGADDTEKSNGAILELSEHHQMEHAHASPNGSRRRSRRQVGGGVFESPEGPRHQPSVPPSQPMPQTRRDVGTALEDRLSGTRHSPRRGRDTGRVSTVSGHYDGVDKELWGWGDGGIAWEKEGREKMNSIQDSHGRVDNGPSKTTSGPHSGSSGREPRWNDCPVSPFSSPSRWASIKIPTPVAQVHNLAGLMTESYYTANTGDVINIVESMEDANRVCPQDLRSKRGISSSTSLQLGGMKSTISHAVLQGWESDRIHSNVSGKGPAKECCSAGAASVVTKKARSGFSGWRMGNSRRSGLPRKNTTAWREDENNNSGRLSDVFPPTS